MYKVLQNWFRIILQVKAELHFQLLKGNTCSWKEQLQNRKVGKFEVGKFSFKLESNNRSWKVLNAVLSNQNFSNFILSNFISNFPT